MALDEPLLPLKLFKISNYNAAAGVACVGTMVFESMTVIWPQQVAALYSTNNIEIGWLSVRFSLFPALIT